MKWLLVYIAVNIPAYVYLASNLSGTKYLVALMLLMIASIGSRFVGYMEEKNK